MDMEETTTPLSSMPVQIPWDDIYGGYLYLDFSNVASKSEIVITSDKSLGIERRKTLIIRTNPISQSNPSESEAYLTVIQRANDSLTASLEGVVTSSISPRSLSEDNMQEDEGLNE